MTEFAPAPKPSSHPQTSLPEGACDTHTHVFGPEAKFPFPVSPSYAPPLAPFEEHQAMMDAVGLTYGVLVQPAPYGDDCSAILDAVDRADGRLKGVATAFADAKTAHLSTLADAGIAGLRFVETGAARMPGAASFDDLERLAPLMKDLGLHAQIWADCSRIAAAGPWLSKLGVPVVVEHMGRFDADKGVDAPEFQSLLSLLSDEAVWVKLGVCRTSQGPGYDAARPFHDAFIAANPRRLLWASDWPYVKMQKSHPDPGKLLDLFDSWTSNDRDLRHRILVENPGQLYGFSS